MRDLKHLSDDNLGKRAGCLTSRYMYLYAIIVVKLSPDKKRRAGMNNLSFFSKILI